jgi:hypothetical protein
MTMRIGMRYIRRIISKITAINPAASCYDILIGTIWSQVYGTYDGFEGKIWFPEPNTASGIIGGGTYDKRV